MRVSNTVKTWFCKSICATLAAVTLELLAGCGGGSNISSNSSESDTGDAFVYLPVCHETEVGQCSNSGAIFGFSNDSSGALTPVTGSPFSSPGSPSGVAVTPDGKFLYVSLFNNNLVTGYSINPASGALTPLSCLGTANTGAQPFQIVIAPSGSFLYTVDTGSLNGTGYSITAFSIDAGTGCLTVLQTSLTEGPPRAAAIDRTGHFLYVCIAGTPAVPPAVNAYSISTTGTLTRQSASDFNNGNFFSSLAADPVADLLFAVEGRSTTGQVNVLSIDSATGALTHVATSLTGGDSAEDIAIDSLGTVVFIANVVGGVGAYSLADGGALTAFNDSPVGPTDPGPEALVIDPSGKFLYGTNTADSNSFVVTFSLGSGTLTQQGTISLDPGAKSIAVVRRQ